MKNKKLIFILVTEFIFVCALLLSFSRAENKEIIFGVTMNPMERRTTFSGKGAADISEFTQNAIDEFKRLYGYTLTPKLYSGPKFLFKAVESKTVDFSPMFLAVYLSAKNQGLPVTPFMAATPFEKGERYCLYVHKDSGIKNAAQLKGSVLCPIFLFS